VPIRPSEVKDQNTLYQGLDRWIITITDTNQKGKPTRIYHRGKNTLRASSILPVETTPLEEEVFPITYKGFQGHHNPSISRSTYCLLWIGC